MRIYTTECKWRTVVDRLLLAAAVLAGGLIANHHVSTPTPARFIAHAESDVRCRNAEPTRRLEPRRDMFVPAAPNEPMESLEN